MIESLRKEFEKTELFRKFNDNFDVTYLSIGGYVFTVDNKPCYYLNGALAMYVEMKK